MFDGPWVGMAIRWGVFAALVVLIGAAAFRILVLGRLPMHLLEAHGRWISCVGFRSAVALVILAFARLGLQVAELHDPGEPWTTPAAMMLWETTWGIGWWLQVGAALLCGAGFVIARHRTIGWTIVALGTVMLAATPALSGHAIGSSRLSALAVAGDTLHVMGAGTWLGSLAIALGTVMSAGRTTEPQGAAAEDVAVVIRAFSPVALASAALVLTSGILASWLHVGTVALLWETTYGRLLLVKAALFAIIVALGAFNWRRQTPRLTTEAGVESLRASARAELAVALLVLLVTAALVATPLPGEE